VSSSPASGPSPETLAPIYRPEEQESWRLFREHLEITSIELFRHSADSKFIWLDMEPGNAEDFDTRDEAWRTFLRGLNGQRNRLQASLDGNFVIAAPIRLQPIMRAEAPDLWSVRDIVVKIQALGVNRAAMETLPITSARSTTPAGHWKSPISSVAKKESTPLLH